MNMGWKVSQSVENTDVYIWDHWWLFCSCMFLNYLSHFILFSSLLNFLLSFQDEVCEQELEGYITESGLESKTII